MQVKDFLEQLCGGIREIPKKHHSLFYALQKLDAISKKGKTFILKEGYAIGELDVIREDLIFLKSFSPSHQKDFKLMKAFKGSVSGDIVLVKTISKSTRARLVSILYCPPLQTLAYLEKVKGKICALELKSTQEKPLQIPIKARQKALSSLPPHTVIKVDMRNGEIVEVLGVLEDERIDEKIILSLYHLKEEFSSSSVQMAQSFGDSVFSELYPSRKDLTHLPFCTIDPSDAKDHDDAIYFNPQEQKLYVAIADVSEYVSKESSIDREARERGFSLYLPHKSIPMLPRELSENICSLKEGEIRLAFVWEITLSSCAKVEKSSLFEALILNHCNLSYERVNDLIEKNKTENIPKNIIESIRSFYPYAKKLFTHRLKKGYTFFADEVKLILDENTALQDIKISAEGVSHHIVEEAMLLANVESAKLMQSLKCKGIYRIHEEMKEEKIFELLSAVRSLGYEGKSKDIHSLITSIQKWAKERGVEKEIDKMIIKAQKQAVYSSENLGHFGLGFEIYTHFTSPIRRYSDLLLHRLLKEYLQGGKKLAYLSEGIGAVCKSLSESEKRISRAEMEYKDRKFAHWAREHIGERIKVSVIDTQYPILTQALEKIYGARVVLKDKIMCEKFDTFEIIIEEVNLANARIFGRIND